MRIPERSDVCICASDRVTMFYLPRPAIVDRPGLTQSKVPGRIVAKIACPYHFRKPDEGRGCIFAPSIDVCRIWASDLPADRRADRSGFGWPSAQCFGIGNHTDRSLQREPNELVIDEALLDVVIAAVAVVVVWQLR